MGVLEFRRWPSMFSKDRPGTERNWVIKQKMDATRSRRQNKTAAGPDGHQAPLTGAPSVSRALGAGSTTCTNPGSSTAFHNCHARAALARDIASHATPLSGRQLSSISASHHPASAGQALHRRRPTHYSRTCQIFLHAPAPDRPPMPATT